jgi:hypothetical protein
MRSISGLVNGSVGLSVTLGAFTERAGFLIREELFDRFGDGRDVCLLYHADLAEGLPPAPDRSPLTTIADPERAGCTRP